ncbi:MAG: hypothetical protein PHY02_03725 [Phycisphaerae bacterium]|nr:hypothetical protein [Phycisphaerae bacterium]
MKKTFILTAGVIILIAGCGGQDTSNSETNRWRLIAVENTQLKKQSEQLGKELKEQKELFAKSSEITKKQLKAVTEENSILRQTAEMLEGQIKQLEEELETLMDSEKFKKWQEETQKSFDDVAKNSVRNLEKIAELQEENEKLKAEITELKK